MARVSAGSALLAEALIRRLSKIETSGLIISLQGAEEGLQRLLMMRRRREIIDIDFERYPSA
jgi:hypothetical protein